MQQAELKMNHYESEAGYLKQCVHLFLVWETLSEILFENVSRNGIALRQLIVCLLCWPFFGAAQVSDRPHRVTARQRIADVCVRP
jgi:D-hexose-6-phosphate mutarotase